MSVWNGLVVLALVGSVTISLASVALMLGSALCEALEWTSRHRVALLSFMRRRLTGLVVGLLMGAALGTVYVVAVKGEAHGVCLQNTPRAGSIIDRDSLDDLRPFREGYAAAQKHGRWGYVDVHGRVVIGFDYIDGREFSEGLGAVQTLEGWGYVDTSGRMVIAPRLTAARMFREGLAPACNGVLWGYLDRSGAWRIKPRYVLASPFQEGTALVTSRDAKICRIDRADRLLEIVCTIPTPSEAWTECKAGNDYHVR